MPSLSHTPAGVVGIVTSPDGRVIATATDFDTNAPGGFTLLEAQKHRVQEALAASVVEAGCADWIRGAVTATASSRIFDHLVRLGGFGVNYIQVGQHGNQ